MKFHNRSSGYTSFVQTFALFSSSFEVSIQRSPVLRAFNDINTEHKFKQLKLPTKLTEMNGLKIYEIDLSQRKQIKRSLRTEVLDCLPMVFVVSSPNSNHTEFEFSQPILAKYFQLQLIQGFQKQSSVVSSMNIDMYSLSFYGQDVEVPTQLVESPSFPKEERMI